MATPKAPKAEEGQDAQQAAMDAAVADLHGFARIGHPFEPDPQQLAMDTAVAEHNAAVAAAQKAAAEK